MGSDFYIPARGRWEGNTTSPSITFLPPSAASSILTVTHTKQLPSVRTRAGSSHAMALATALNGKHSTYHLLFTEKLLLKWHSQELAITPFYIPAEMVPPSEAMTSGVLSQSSDQQSETQKLLVGNGVSIR